MDADPALTYFDGVADSYDEVLPFFSTFAREMVDRVGVAAGTRALDLAAGRGAITAELLARGAGVVAVDGAPRMVELLARDQPAAGAHVMDAARLELSSATFDLVICGFALHLFADAEAALAEVSRVLAPGGTAAFTVGGRADGSPDPWEDPLVDLFAEYRHDHADGSGRLGHDIDEDALIAAAFSDVVATTLEVAIPVPDGATYWRWSRSHGSGTFINGLSPARREEMRSRLLAEVEARRGS